MLIPIQQVAKQIGISVRTLRYYDQIGLLPTMAKTEGGHRLYTEEDLKKLQQILFLKEMGFRLDDIKQMLQKQDWNWASSLKSQLAYVQKEQERLRSMELSLRELISGVAVDGAENVVALQKLIRLSGQDKAKQIAFKSALLNDKELDLWQRLPHMNAADPHSMEWIALLAQVKQVMVEGPSSPKVQSIIRRMCEKMDEQFGDEPEFLDKLWELRKSPASSEQLGFYPIEQNVIAFLDEAFAFYDANTTAVQRKGEAAP